MTRPSLLHELGRRQFGVAMSPSRMSIFTFFHQSSSFFGAVASGRRFFTTRPHACLALRAGWRAGVDFESPARSHELTRGRVGSASVMKSRTAR